jgi:hypothetical protein
MDRLRTWVEEEGYEVLEEVVDGYSVASLVTPGTSTHTRTRGRR